MSENRKNLSKPRFWFVMALGIAVASFLIYAASPHPATMPDWTDFVMFLLAGGAMYMGILAKMEK
jgi:tryptophan-rich sensory protein